MTDEREDDGQLHTRAASDFHFRVDAMMRQLENPNLHDIQNMSYGIDLWDGHGWLVAASGNVFVARAAFEEATKQWPAERLTLRNGMQLLNEHPQPLGKPR
jgi:hypothetical protein